MTTGTHRRDELLARIERGLPLPTPSPGQVLETVLALSRQVQVTMDEEALVRAHLAAFQDLLLGRRFSVRLVDSETGDLTLVYSTDDGASTDDEDDGAARISRPALERHSVHPDSIAQPGIEVVDEYQSEFGTDGGFDVPLMDGHHIVGVLGVGYYAAATPAEDDGGIIGQLGLQLAANLRNARLMRESLYLRDYLGKLLDHANAPIVVIGPDRDIRVVNRALLSLTGMTRQELVGLDFVSIVPENERRRLLPAFIDALRGRPTTNFELKLPRADGGHARISLNIASILSADGEVEGVIGIGRDLTEVRDLEEQVIQAEKLATLGQLAAGVVHELNNPLTSISVYGEYLLKKAEHAEAPAGDVEKLRRIVHSAERILRFTRDLVVYARPTAEEAKLLSMRAVLEQSIVFCEHVITECGATVERRFTSGSLQIRGVKGQLHQVFINLITNACHAMPDGAGRLVLSTNVSIDGTATVRVKDNGTGIPDDQRHTIFEPFFSTKGEGKGTGLGLSIVRNIVQQHRGEIRVESSPGEGTTFEVMLPPAEPADDDDAELAD